MAYVQAMHQSGVVKSGAGLQEPGTGTTVRVVDGKRRVQDGPFADTKEQLGGFFVIDVPDLDTALSWAARAPCAATGGVEVRRCSRRRRWADDMPARTPGTGRGRRARLLRPAGRHPVGAHARHRGRGGRARRRLRARARPLAGRRRAGAAGGLAAGRWRAAACIDAWRHGRVEDEAAQTLLDGSARSRGDAAAAGAVPDERLRLMFVCAHPAIDPAARAPLMLQTVLGLDAARIASAFLVSAGDAGRNAWCAPRPRSAAPASPSKFRGPDEMAARGCADVLEAIYAAYGTGWDDVAGTDPERSGLAQEALTLGGDARPPRPAMRRGVGPAGAACLLRVARRRAPRRRGATTCRCSRRTRRLWDRELLGVGEAALRPRPRRSPRPARFQLEAAIQSAHTQRRLGASVPDAAIVALYDALVATAADDRRARQPRLRRRRRPTARRPAVQALAALRRRRCGRLPAVLGRPRRISRPPRAMSRRRRAARERAVGLSTDPAVRRFLLRGTERQLTAASHPRRPYWRPSACIYRSAAAMCQLLGMNANTPTDVMFSFTGFATRAEEHKDGFGIAFFEDQGVRLFVDAQSARESPVAEMVRRYPIRSENIVAHIRKATQGRVALENTHPFVRELWGRYWVFAHNGDLQGLRAAPARRVPAGRRRPTASAPSAG